MRIRLLLVCISAALFGAGFGIQACGGSSTDAPADAGGDAADASIDTSPAVKDSAPACDPTNDFLKNIPDASVLDGATTSGICLGCAKSKCKGELANCAKDCVCQESAAEAVSCYLSGTSVFKCAGKFANVPTSTRNLGLAIFGCLNGQCEKECATASFNPDAGDAATDADAN